MANRTQLQVALQKPYDRILFAKEILNPVFGSGFSLSSNLVPASVQPNKSEQAVIDKVSIYGKITLEDSTEITCYEILLQPHVRIEQSKVAIQRYVRKMLTAGQGALVNFVVPLNKNVWRLTLVAKDSELTADGIKEKTTHAKRYTYLLGPNETCKTAAERFEILSTERRISFDSLINAFSVERLSKAFFDEYTLHYEHFCEYLQNSNFRKSVFNVSFPVKATEEEKDKASKPIRDFTKKLLGRIVFLYFVQKKGWLGASDTNYNDGRTDFMKHLFDSSGGDDTFYSNWLSVLFFDTLNKERTNDDFKMPDGKKLKVPFLNGGLFDKEGHDEHILTFKPKLFHNHDFEDVILTEKIGVNGRGFLDFLDAFNFTVHEDSPDDHTVAVDPEMLGHIFENLLEDNKDKGAFYTPKEIVHYMCQESLIEYLSTHLSKEYTVYRQIDKEQIEIFGNETRQGQLKMMEALGDKALNRDDVAYIVKYKDISQLTKGQLKRIDTLLDSVKICDPAIGSGAFPMGLLQEIFAIKEVIAYDLGEKWKPAEVKENIIQNSIYGVDIEKGAVDIARLRFWLSLVVDEDIPRALPNLDYKIVVGNSLVSKVRLDDHEEIVEIDWNKVQQVSTTKEYIENIQQLLKDIATKQKKFFKPETKDKKKLQNEIRNLKLDLLINQLSLNKEKYLAINKNKGGFAPTASDIKFNTEILINKRNFENLINKLQNIKNDRDQPFEHFDWKLDFPEILNPNLVLSDTERGFDIVIGNPPYVGQKGHKELFQEIKNAPLGLKYHQRRMDLFYFFFHCGIQSLRDGGVLSFITTNYYLTATYADKLRSHIYEETSISLLINFNELKIFESATGQHNLITSLIKGKSQNVDAYTAITKRTGVASLNILNSILDRTDSQTDYYIQDQNSIFDKENLYIRIEPNQKSDGKESLSIHSVLNKVRLDNKTLDEYCFIEQGIVSGADKVSDSLINKYPDLDIKKGEGIYIVTNDEVQSKGFSSKDRAVLKKTYKNSDLRKWTFRPDDTLNVIYIKSNGTYFEISSGIKKHLDNYKLILINRNVRAGSITEKDYERFIKGEVEISYIMNSSSMKSGNYYCLSYPRGGKSIFEVPKIVNSRRANSNTFALEDKGYYEQSDIVVTTLKPVYQNKISIYFILAILNSKLMYYWFYHKGKRKGDALELFQKPISEVPIKITDSSFQSKIADIVLKIIEAKKQDPLANVLMEEAKLDILIYHLYQLTYEESKIVDSTLSEMEFNKYLK